MSRDAGPRARVTRQRRGGVSIASTELSALVARALRRAGAPANGEVVLTLVDDATIAKLNATHMGKRGPTDVLSFPLIDPREFPVRASAQQRGVAAQLPIGDIVISVDRAAEQARAPASLGSVVAESASPQQNLPHSLRAHCVAPAHQPTAKRCSPSLMTSRSQSSTQRIWGSAAQPMYSASR